MKKTILWFRISFIFVLSYYENDLVIFWENVRAHHCQNLNFNRSGKQQIKNLICWLSNI